MPAGMSNGSGRKAALFFQPNPVGLRQGFHFRAHGGFCD